MKYELPTTDAELWYPRNSGAKQTVRVSLYDVRAADDLIIGYDFDRDGWTIARSDQPDEEVSFIRAWADLEDK